MLVYADAKMEPNAITLQVLALVPLDLQADTVNWVFRILKNHNKVGLSLNELNLNSLRLASSLVYQSKKLGKGKFTVSGRLITDDEIDLGQVYNSLDETSIKVALGIFDWQS